MPATHADDADGADDAPMLEQASSASHGSDATSAAADQAQPKLLHEQSAKRTVLPRKRGVPRYTAYNVFVKQETELGLALPQAQMAKRWKRLSSQQHQAYKRMALEQTLAAHDRHDRLLDESAARGLLELSSSPT